MTESARNVPTKANLATNDVDLYVPHQANLRIMNMVREKLGIDEEHLMISVNQHGNTSAASVPLALDKAHRSGRLKRGGSRSAAGSRRRFYLGLRIAQVLIVNKKKMQDKKIAFVFPGQGSQAVGMLSTLADEPIVHETLKEADEAFRFCFVQVDC